MNIKATLVPISVLLLLTGKTWADSLRIALPQSKTHPQQIYVYRGKAGQTSSIILASHRKLFYGTGGPQGTRHKVLAGFYKIQGKTIILFEFNGHKSLGEGHQTYFPYTPKTIDAGLGKIYHRLR